MALGNYKLMRLMCFMFVAIISPLACFAMFFLQVPLMGILVWSVVASLVLGLIGYIITGMNPWIQAVQGDGIIVVDINSTGVGKFYVASVKNNPFGGIDLNVDFGGGQTETRVYDRKITHRIQSPLKVFMQPWKKKPVPVEEKVEVKTP